MGYESLIYEKKEGVARITINRPSAMNAITPTLLEELKSAMTDAGKDDHPCSFIGFQITKRIEGHDFVPNELRLTKIGEGKMTVGMGAISLADELHVFTIDATFNKWILLLVIQHSTHSRHIALLIPLEHQG